MSTIRIVVLATVGLVLLSGTAFALTEVLRQERSTRTVVARPIHRIVVRSEAGDVDIRAGLTAAVTVMRRDRYLLQRPTVRQVVRGDELDVDVRCGDVGGALRCRSDLELDVPPDVDVLVRSQDGDIDLRGLHGRADVHTESGDIAAHRLVPIVVTATTRAGDVDLDVFGQPARTEARSAAGDIEVVVPYGAYRIEADGTNTKVTGLLRDDLAPQRIVAFTEAGDTLVRAR